MLILCKICALIDSNGNVVVEYKYDAWGDHVIVLSDSSHENLAKANPFRYRGYYYDEETGLYYLKTRYYDPETGRFVTIDDVSYLDPDTINGLNLYAYCGNNPVMNVDPNGTFILSLFLICLGVGLVAGAVTGGITAYNNGYRGWDLVGQIALGGLTGAALGATVGLVAGMGTAAIIGGLSSVAGKFVSDITASAISQSWAFGSWEDYAISFAFGGISKGLLKGLVGKYLLNVIVAPLVTQVIQKSTRGAEFNIANYLYTAITNSATYFANFGMISIAGTGIQFSIIQSLLKGIYKGLWKILPNI